MNWTLWCTYGVFVSPWPRMGRLIRCERCVLFRIMGDLMFLDSKRHSTTITIHLPVKSWMTFCYIDYYIVPKIRPFF